MFFNSFLYALYFFLGTWNVAFDLIPLNALEPTFFNTVDLIVTLFNFLQFWNAFVPMVFTFLSRVMDVIVLHPRNA